MSLPEVKKHLVLCGVCREPLGHILFLDDPMSHQTSPLGWPKKGAMALAGSYPAHVLGEKVHLGRVVEETGMVLGEVGIKGLDALDRLQRPIESLRYRGLGAEKCDELA